MAAIAQTQKEIALTDFAKNIEQSARAIAEVRERFVKTNKLVHKLTRFYSREFEKAFADFVKRIWPHFKQAGVVFGFWPRMVELSVLSVGNIKPAFCGSGKNEDATSLCLAKNGIFYIRRRPLSGVLSDIFDEQTTLEIFETYGLEKILHFMHNTISSQIPILEDKIKELENQRERVLRLRF